MATKTYYFKSAFSTTDPVTGQVIAWRPGIVDRITNIDLQDVLDTATGAYGEKVAIDLGATFVEDTDFNSWPLSTDVLSLLAAVDTAGFLTLLGDPLVAADLSTDVNTFLAQANKAALRTTGLGGGASGVAAFQAEDRYSFLGNSGVRYGPVTIAAGAAVSFPLREASCRHLLLITGSGGAFGFVHARTQSGALIADVLLSNSNFTSQVGALSGSTGPSGNINFGVSAGTGYLENRGAYPNPIQVVIFEG